MKHDLGTNAASFPDSDLELGRTVRASCSAFAGATSDSVGVAYAAMLALVRLSDEMGGTNTTVRLDGMHKDGIALGDWKVIVKRVKAPITERKRESVRAERLRKATP